MIEALKFSSNHFLSPFLLYGQTTKCISVEPHLDNIAQTRVLLSEIFWRCFDFPLKVDTSSLVKGDGSWFKVTQMCIMVVISWTSWCHKSTINQNFSWLKQIRQFWLVSCTFSCLALSSMRTTRLLMFLHLKVKIAFSALIWHCSYSFLCLRVVSTISSMCSWIGLGTK